MRPARFLVVALALGVPVVLAACGATPRAEDQAVTIGQGTLGPSAWSVTVYQSVEYGRCMQAHFETGDRGGVCEGSSGGLATTVLDDPAGGGSVVVIDVADEGWTDGKVTLDNGSTVPVTAMASGLGRFFVFGIAAPRTAQLVDLHNAVSGRTEQRHLR